MDYFEFQKDLERINLIDQFQEFDELLRKWENDIFFNPSDIPIIYKKIILPLKTYPTNLQHVLLKQLLEFRKTCNRSGSGAWEYLEKYYYEMRKTQNQEPPPPTDQEPGKAKQPKKIQDLPEIFKSRDYFDLVIKKTSDYWSFDRETGCYHWDNTKSLLAGLAYQLREANRLKKDYPGFDPYNPQDLSRVFCKFFGLKPDEKTFKLERVTQSHREPFKWIVDFDQK